MKTYGLAFVDAIDEELDSFVKAYPPVCIADHRSGAWWAFQYQYGPCPVYKTPYEMVRLDPIQSIVVNEQPNDALPIIAYALCMGRDVYYYGKLSAPKPIWRLAGRYGVYFAAGDMAGLREWLEL